MKDGQEEAEINKILALIEAGEAVDESQLDLILGKHRRWDLLEALGVSEDDERVMALREVEAQEEVVRTDAVRAGILQKGGKGVDAQDSAFLRLPVELHVNIAGFLPPPNYELDPCNPRPKFRQRLYTSPLLLVCSRLYAIYSTIVEKYLADDILQSATVHGLEPKNRACGGRCGAIGCYLRWGNLARYGHISTVKKGLERLEPYSWQYILIYRHLIDSLLSVRSPDTCALPPGRRAVPEQCTHPSPRDLASQRFTFRFLCACLGPAGLNQVLWYIHSPLYALNEVHQSSRYRSHSLALARILLESGTDLSSEQADCARHRRIAVDAPRPPNRHLDAAVSDDNLDFVKLLLERGADPNLGYTPGHSIFINMRYSSHLLSLTDGLERILSRMEIGRLLILAGAKGNPFDIQTMPQDRTTPVCQLFRRPKPSTAPSSLVEQPGQSDTEGQHEDLIAIEVSYTSVYYNVIVSTYLDLFEAGKFPNLPHYLNNIGRSPGYRSGWLRQPVMIEQILYDYDPSALPKQRFLAEGEYRQPSHPVPERSAQASLEAFGSGEGWSPNLFTPQSKTGLIKRLLHAGFNPNTSPELFRKNGEFINTLIESVVLSSLPKEEQREIVGLMVEKGASNSCTCGNCYRGLLDRVLGKHGRWDMVGPLGLTEEDEKVVDVRNREAELRGPK
ncbi:hypothetical protein BJ508DRAFT_151092 [Ascobolus immersus RN42]|uniref:Ankyrin n=1 Tax=Ascobolus immersus RN42 TaxID=1160509 RepID=A0A3N4HYL6_ASCIM|nr:hypothetical protein BJ508DRAFT_151092 [Ascobolus immersus RN42]